VAGAGIHSDDRVTLPDCVAPDHGADADGNRVEVNIVVRDTGFHADDGPGTYIPWSGNGSPPVLPPNAAIDVENTVRAEHIAPAFERIALIRIGFTSHMDGRGFSLARHLRLLGFRGRLRAFGHILADQYVMARRSGFDEVEIEPSLASRQSEEQWLFRANWRENNYQERLRQPPRTGQYGNRVKPDSCPDREVCQSMFIGCIGGMTGGQ